MNATATNRLIAYKRKLLILELLEKEHLNISQIAEKICDSFVIIKADVKKLYLQRYLSRKKIYDLSLRKSVYAYITKRKDLPAPNVNATNKQKEMVANIDFENDVSRKKHPNKIDELPKQITKHEHIVVDPKNPNITTYLNLGRAGSDYAWQRPKRKTTSVNIGSTFSLYDSATL